jgi:hypothetical protein
MGIKIPIFIPKGFLFQSFTKLHLISFPIQKLLSGNHNFVSLKLLKIFEIKKLNHSLRFHVNNYI